jgi:hypothetical protein
MTAKADRRVLILDQLESILAGMSIPLLGNLIGGPTLIPPGNIVRNRNELPRELVPGLILLDADETRDPRVPELSGRGSRPGPSLMRMTPEIYVVLDVRKPSNTNVGEDLYTARQLILNKVLHDTTLQALTGDNGTITYDGCVTDLARNREMRGQLGMSITFVYPFIPDELLPL